MMHSIAEPLVITDLEGLMDDVVPCGISGCVHEAEWVAQFHFEHCCDPELFYCGPCRLMAIKLYNSRPPDSWQCRVHSSAFGTMDVHWRKV